MCISVSNYVCFTLSPGLSNGLQAEPGGRAWSLESRLGFAAPWIVQTCADTVCSLMGCGKSSGACSASSARWCSSLMPTPVSQPWPHQSRQFLLCCWPQPQHGVQMGPPVAPGWIYEMLQLLQENITQDVTAAAPVKAITGSSRMTLFQICLVSASKESQVSGSAQQYKSLPSLLPCPLPSLSRSSLPPSSM